MKDVSGLHVILGGLELVRLLELARLAEGEGAAVIQLREKNLPTAEILKHADALRGVVKRAAFIINDRADIALAVGAEGVHLGQDDLPIEAARMLLGHYAIIGASTSNIEEALAAQKSGANYLGFGHMFATRSKEKSDAPRSVADLQAVVAAVSLPVIAIGGITLSNLGSVRTPGLGGVAVISAVTEATNPAQVIRELVRALEQRHAALS